MIASDVDQEMVTLLPDQLSLTDKEDLSQFMISEWSLEHRNTSDLQEGIRVRVVLQRKPMADLMTIYLPSVLLVMVTFLTSLFKPFFFEAALSVNLTTMLIFTVIFNNVMQRLPLTAYVKMIDVWLIFCQLIPFSEVVLLTIAEYLRKGDGSGNEKTCEGEEVSIIFNMTSVPMDPPIRI